MSIRNLASTKATVLTLAGVLLFAPAADAGSKKKKTPEQERVEELRHVERKLARRLRVRGLTADSKFLHDRASELIGRARTQLNDGYLFDRTRKAADALLEASERLIHARLVKEDQHSPEDLEHARLKTSSELQKDYFRLLQADFFAQTAKEAQGDSYLMLAQRFYQKARAAYDSGHYEKARKLGDGASWVVRALEYLAQARVRGDEPPRLPPAFGE